MVWVRLPTFLLLLLVTTAILLFITPTTIVALPIGFVDEGVGSMAATSGRFAPNPRPGANAKPMLIVSSIDGRFYIIEDPDNAGPRIEIGTMNHMICENGPRGVLGFDIHPDFGTLNYYIYVYYTGIVPDCPASAATGPSQRLSRFTIDPVSLLLNITSEVILLETPPQLTLIHVGGAMTIGTDRYIYLCIGDGGHIKQAQNLRFLYGKLIRLDLNGNVPASNPYTIASGGTGVPCRNNKGIPPTNAPPNSVCEEIYAYGLRNPFKLGVDMNAVGKVRFAIGDVGNALWEEASYGGTDFRGTNYGWSTTEGPCNLNSRTDCPISGPNSTEPFYYYMHRPGGGAITGSVFVPNGLWPSTYQYMIFEYIEGLMLNLIDDPSDGCRTCVPPRPYLRNETFHEFDRVVDVFFGPYKDTKAMYYLSRAGGDNVRRIRYVGGTNRPPKAIISTMKRGYLVRDEIDFVGSNSTDDDGDQLTFLWKFGDGRTSTVPNPVLSYSTAGTYTVELTVTDIGNLTSRVFESIAVGMPPTADIISPPDGYQFAVGDFIHLEGSGIDAFGNPLNSSQLSWEVNIQHENHFHPFMRLRSGNNFTFSPAPEPEDFMAATNSLLQFILTTVDSYGLSTTYIRYIYPKKVFIDIESNIPGLRILVGEFAVVAPVTITAWQDQILKLEAEDQGQYQFQLWSIGGDRVVYYNALASEEMNPITNTTLNSKIHVNFTVFASPTKVPTKSPTIAPFEAICHLKRWDLFNSETDLKVIKLTNGTTVTNPPPCNRTNIEVALRCSPTSNISVTIELFHSGNDTLVRRSVDKLSRYFLFGNSGNKIKDGRIPAGSYKIRAIWNGKIGSFTTFTLGGGCV